VEPQGGADRPAALTEAEAVEVVEAVEAAVFEGVEEAEAEASLHRLRWLSVSPATLPIRSLL
jgi:hypothetical protein